jgi:hypothetical protein
MLVAGALFGEKSILWQWLERVANAGIVLATGLLIWYVWHPLANSRQTVPEIVKAGDRLTVEGLSDSGPDRRLLVVFRANCVFCAASLPFYRELVDMGAADRLSFVSPPGEGAATARALHEAEIRPVPVLTADFAKNKFHVTPLVLAIDTQRTVRAVWRGKLSTSAEAEVRQTLQAMTRRP